MHVYVTWMNLPTDDTIYGMKIFTTYEWTKQRIYGEYVLCIHSDSVDIKKY